MTDRMPGGLLPDDATEMPPEPTIGASGRRRPSLLPIGMVVSAIIAVVGGGVLFAGFAAKGRLDLLSAAVPVSLAELAEAPAQPGPLRVEATVHTDAPVRMKGRGEQVVWGSLEIEARVRVRDTRQNTTKTRDATLYDEAWLAEPLELRSGDVTLPIDRKALQLGLLDCPEVKDTVEWRSGGSLLRPTDVRYGDLELHIPDSLWRHARSGRRPTVTVRKQTLASGDPVLVICGTAKRDGKTVITAPGDAEMMLFGRQDAETVAARFESKSGWMLPLGGALLGLGLLAFFGCLAAKVSGGL